MGVSSLALLDKLTEAYAAYNPGDILNFDFGLAHSDIFKDASPENIRLRRHRTDRLSPSADVQVLQGNAVNQYLTLIPADLPGQYFQEGGLARTAGTRDADLFAG